MAGLFSITAETNTAASPFEFDTITTANGNTMGPTTGDFYSGEKSYQYNYAGSGANCYGYKAYSATTEMFVSMYIKFSSDFAMSGTWRSFCLTRIMQGQWNPCLRLAIASGGTTAPYRWYITGNGITDTYSTSGVTIGVWIPVELYWKYGANSTTVVRVWINSVSVMSVTNVSCAYTDTSRCYVGGTGEYSYPANGSEVFYDDINVYNAIPSGAVHVDVTATLISIAVAPYAPAIAGGANIAPSLVGVGVATYSPAIAGGAAVSASLDSVGIATYAATVAGGAAVQASLISVAVASFAATIAGGVNFSASLIGVGVATNSPIVSGHADFTASLNSVALATFAASVSGGAEVLASLITAAIAIYAATIDTGTAGSVDVSASLANIAIGIYAPTITNSSEVIWCTCNFTFTARYETDLKKTYNFNTPVTKTYQFNSNMEAA